MATRNSKHTVRCSQTVQCWLFDAFDQQMFRVWTSRTKDMWKRYSYDHNQDYESEYSWDLSQSTPRFVVTFKTFNLCLVLCMESISNIEKQQRGTKHILKGIETQVNCRINQKLTYLWSGTDDISTNTDEISVAELPNSNNTYSMLKSELPFFLLFLHPNCLENIYSYTHKMAVCRWTGHHNI